MMADTVTFPVLSAAELAECAEFGTDCSFAAGGPRSNRDCDAESLRRYSREKGVFGSDRATQSSRKTRRDRRDHRVSRVRQGVVRHRVRRTSSTAARRLGDFPQAELSPRGALRASTSSA